MTMTDFNGLETSRIMSDHDLAVLGLQHVAYVKPVTVEGSAAYSIHAADGTEIAVLGNHDVAVATIRHHDMEPICLQ